MFIQSIKSELYKMRYTKSIKVILIMLAIFSTVTALILGFSARKELGADLFGETLVSSTLTSIGLTSIIPLSLIIFFITLTATSEYSNETRTYTHLATPNRITAALGKLTAVSLVGIIITLILNYVNQLLFLLMQVGNYAVPVDKNSLLTVPLGIAVAVPILTAFIHGLAYILRSTSGVLVIMLIMLMRIDNIVIFFPKVGELFDYLFIRNVRALWSATFVPEDFLKALGIALAWSIVSFGIGIFSLKKRDT